MAVLLYALHPICILSALTTSHSSNTSATHLLLCLFIDSLATYSLSLSNYCVLFLPCLSLLYLITVNSAYLALLPIIFLRHDHSAGTFILFCVFYILLALLLQIFTASFPNLSLTSFPPSMGIFWYLDLQVFPSVRQYFDALILFQPVLFSPPIAYALRSKPTVAAVIIASMVLLYSRQLSPHDCILLLTLLLTCHDISFKMKHWPLILLGVTVSMAVSPLLLHLWIGLGAGNANYLFFNGLLLWVCLAGGVLEFTSVALLSLKEC